MAASVASRTGPDAPPETGSVKSRRVGGNLSGFALRHRWSESVKAARRPQFLRNRVSMPTEVCCRGFRRRIQMDFPTSS
jgi:hypothetical protein